MSQKTLNTRIQHKHDTEANWKKATNFVPLQGEIIVYDADDYNPVQRIKVGDGETTVSRLPFAVRPIEEIEFNAATGSDLYFLTGVTFADGISGSGSYSALNQGIDKKVFIGGGANSGELHADRFIGTEFTGTAAKANNDGNGNLISKTYIKGIEIEDNAIKPVLGDGTYGTSTDLGLGSAAYTESTAYDAAGLAEAKANAALDSAKIYADKIKNDLLNGAGAAYDTLKELGDLIDDNQDAIEALETVATGKVGTTAQTFTEEQKTQARENISAASVEYVEKLGLPVVTTTGTDTNYTATVPGITELTSGACFIMIPHVNSATDTTPFLNVNNLGEKSVYRYNSSGRFGYDGAQFYSNQAVILMYSDKGWIVLGVSRPEASDLNGTVRVNRGGTGKMTLTAGSYLVGNGTSAVTLKTPTQVLADIGAISEEDAKLYTDDKIQEYHASMIVDNYLPLTGGAMTGEISLGQGDGNGIQLGTSGYINATKDATTNNTVLGISGSDALIGSIAFNTTLRGFANRPTYNGVDMALYSDVNKCATSDHTHGLLNHYLNIVVPATTEGESWNIIDEKASNTGGMLKAIRMSSQAPEWLEDNYGTGVFFGGGDTRGAISLAYNRPSITLAGGTKDRNTNWHIKMTGTAGITYNLDNIGKISETEVLITVEDIDTICNGTFQYVDANEAVF